METTLAQEVTAKSHVWEGFLLSVLRYWPHLEGSLSWKKFEILKFVGRRRSKAKCGLKNELKIFFFHKHMWYFVSGVAEFIDPILFILYFWYWHWTSWRCLRPHLAYEQKPYYKPSIQMWIISEGQYLKIWEKETPWPLLQNVIGLRCSDGLLMG